IVDSGSSTNETSKEDHRFSLTGTIEEISADRKIRDMGVDRVILNFVFSALGKAGQSTYQKSYSNSSDN
ncbi:MAG: hypothetical protein WA667_07745, partial [Candidatus Nitrosopolaris sp.]